MEFNYYDLRLMLGKDIIETRKRIQDNDRYTNPRYYDIGEIQPDKYYMVSIINEDIDALTSIYIEETIYEKEVK